MKNLFIYAAVIAATMGSMTACSDFLDVKPVTNKQEPDFVSQEGITQLLTGMYARLNSTAARYRRNETCRLFARNPLIGQTGSNRGVFVYISWLEYTFHFDLKSNKDTIFIGNTNLHKTKLT